MQPTTTLPPRTIALINEVLAELKKRGVKNDYCPRCETFDWNVDLNSIPVTPLLPVLPAFLAPPPITSLPPPPFYPAGGVVGGFSSAAVPGGIPAASTYLIVLTASCKNCGYTLFHNLKALGISLAGVNL